MTSTTTHVPRHEHDGAGGVEFGAAEQALVHRYWQAANYLTVAQIYLAENALLREPLTAAHIKPRLLGHWGTSPGQSLHATGAAMDHRDLIVACVIGDGEAETGPLEGSWKAPFFLHPERDGAVLPVLHLNGYKISGPTVLGRQSDDDILAYLYAHGWAPELVSGDDPGLMHPALAGALDRCYNEIRRIQTDVRVNGLSERPRWPAIVLRTPWLHSATSAWAQPRMPTADACLLPWRSHRWRPTRSRSAIASATCRPRKRSRPLG